MQEEDIDLRDYINVILKRKKIILALLFVSLIVTAILGFVTGRAYEISMILEPASVGVAGQGKRIYLNAPADIKAVIETGAFDSAIITALNLDPERPLKFKVFRPKGSAILEVSIRREEQEIKDGIRILTHLFDELSNTYSDEAEFEKDNIEKQISAISNGIAAKNNAIKLWEKTLRVLEERESELIDEIRETKSRKGFGKKDVLLLNYLNELSRELVALKVQKEGIRISIDDSRNMIENLQTDIWKLNLTKDRISNMRLVQKPIVSLTPGKRRKIQNIAIGVVLGLMLGVFIAFFQEFWEKTGSACSRKMGS